MAGPPRYLACRNNDQRYPRRLFPQRELPPMQLFAEVESIVAAQGDDRVVGKAGAIERRNHPPDVPIAIRDGRKIRLHRLSPLATRRDQLMVRRVPRPLPRRRRQVVQVVIADRRQRDPAGIIQIKEPEELVLKKC